MAVHKIVTVYDKAAAAFLQPFFAPTLTYAERQFRDTVNTPDHIFNNHPMDYSLYYLGEYDDQTSAFDLLPGPDHMMTGEQALNPESTTRDLFNNGSLGDTIEPPFEPDEIK